MGTDTQVPSVTVCVTTFEHGAYIRECLESVLAQVFEGTLELLVGDDRSTDGARAIIDGIAMGDPRVRVFHHEQKLGPTPNLQFLVSQARGAAIAHLDGDDYWLPGKLAAQWELLSGDGDIAACYTNATVVAEDGMVLGRFNEGVGVRVDRPQLLRRGNFLNHSSLLYRSSARDAVLGMPPPFIDYRLHLRLLRHGALGYIDEPLVGYRWRTPGSMIRTFPRAVCDGHLDAFEEARRDGAEPADLRAAMGHFWGKVLVQSFASLDLNGAKQIARGLLAIPGTGASRAWLSWQSMLGLPRAVRSWFRRRGVNPVYFP